MSSQPVLLLLETRSMRHSAPASSLDRAEEGPLSRSHSTPNLSRTPHSLSPYSSYQAPGKEQLHRLHPREIEHDDGGKTMVLQPLLMIMGQHLQLTDHTREPRLLRVMLMV
uniref:Uncharacterized protein n=1 Tax=Arundo donax TaxID=35708 RepID=A0A0A8ZFR6_ARUDO